MKKGIKILLIIAAAVIPLIVFYQLFVSIGVLLSGRSGRILEAQHADTYSYSSDKIDISLHEEKLNIIFHGNEDSIYDLWCAFVPGSKISQICHVSDSDGTQFNMETYMSIYSSSSIKITFDIPEDHPLYKLDGKSFWLDRE